MVGQSKSELRRERAAARTREAIVEAAARAFARSGYHGATMAEIADEAGYTAASLYTYFRSKQELLAALIEGVIDELEERTQEPVPASLDLAQGLELRLSRMLGWVDANRERFQVIHELKWAGVMTVPTEPGQRDERGRIAWICGLMEAWFEHPDAELDVAPRDMATALHGLVGGFFERWIEEPDAEAGRLADRASLMTRIILHGVTAKADGGDT